MWIRLGSRVAGTPVWRPRIIFQRLCPSELSPRRECVPGKGGYAFPGNFLLVFLELGELPALGPDEVLGMLLALLGLPIVASEPTFDHNLLTFLREFREVLGGLTPNGHVHESSDLLPFALAIVVKLIVSDGSGSDRSA